MSVSKYHLVGLALLAVAMSPGLQARGSHACELSAMDMKRSCQLETGEELYVTLANCRQLQDESDRHDCRLNAYLGRSEARKTCREQLSARRDACDLLDEGRYADPMLDPTIDFIDPDEIGDGGLSNNPFVILQAGHTHVLRSEDETVIVHATDETREIQGVLCRVVVDIVVEAEFDDEEGEWSYEPIEVTDDWFAQDMYTNVYYCGEVAQNFEDGILRDLDGSFEAGLDYAKGGVLTLAMPAVYQAHRQEYALGEAEDIVKYVDLSASPTEAEGGENENFPCDGTCLKTFDFAPLEPEATEFKYYVSGVGFVLAVGMEDGEITGEREELVCAGDSLDLLDDESCEIEDPDVLRETLCELHKGFCEDE